MSQISNDKSLLKGSDSQNESGIALELVNLKKELHFQKALLDSLPTPLFLKDVQGKYLGCNSAYEVFSGKKKEEIIGKTVFDISPHDLAEIYFKQDSELFASEGRNGPQIYESKVMNSKGERKDVVFYKSAFKNEEGQVAGLIGVILDVTDRNQAVKEKEQMQVQLVHASKLASLGTLSAGVAHEINNPLAIIKANASLLRGLFQGLKKEDLQASKPNALFFEKAEKCIDRQEKSIDRCVTIVNGLKTYSRVDHDEIEEVDVHRSISESMNLYEVIYSKRNITFQSRYAAENSLVKANSGKINQILMNFITNAMDAVEENPQAFIKIETSSDEDFFYMYFSDNGCGIKKENLLHVFDPFFTTKEPGKGTGLGLSISLGLVKDFGGTIHVESELGKGSVFQVKLPLSEKKDLVICV